mmetsp:Transcript_57446/g.95443  ORF Transcript_57446/g.95443 Transcript_57446/m.95443 type:complete len:552 (+) Transcript_57446:110-1765(+)
MLSSLGRRRVIQAKPLHSPSSTLRCSTKIIVATVFAVVAALITLSLYLSTHVLSQQQPPWVYPPLPHDNERMVLDMDMDNERYDHDQSIIDTLLNSEHAQPIYAIDDPKLVAAVQKSLELYLTRVGHMDRVEYLIGLGERRFSIASEQYTQLLPRNLSKTYDRDYQTQPILISGWQPQPLSETPCDTHCATCSRQQCDVDGVRFSMENVQVVDRGNVITGSTRLDSLVPVPYFSYWDFGIMTPVARKSAPSMAAAFISNCGFEKRNRMVTDLQTYGVSVDSYGRCNHNKDEQRNGGRDQTKIGLLSTYKFSLAFENSETDDYITEKFFGSLVSGAVPVYIGAPNVKFFAPDAGTVNVGGPGKPWKSHAVIYAGDFDFDAKKLAQYLIYLDGNDTAYNEYLAWKSQGISGDFKAMIELTSATHTSCRQCILASDWSRYRHGMTSYDAPLRVFRGTEDNDSYNGKWLFVRERGMYRFTLIRLKTNTLQSLVQTVLQSVTPKPVNEWQNNKHPHYELIGPALYAIYHIPSKQIINSDTAIEQLQNYVELEVIFV